MRATMLLAVLVAVGGQAQPATSRAAELPLTYSVAGETARGDLGGPEGQHGVRYADEVHADHGAPYVHLLIGTASGFEPERLLVLPDPHGTADAVALGDLDADERADIVVADRTTRSVILFDGRGDGSRFAAPRVVSSGIDPLQLAVGDFGGDRQHPDLALTDAASGQLTLLISPGDELVVPGGGLQNPSSDAGVLAWSRPASGGTYRLSLRENGINRDVPIAPSSRPFGPRVGRLAAGRPAIAYVACRKGRCTARAWDLLEGRERRLDLHVPSGCDLTTVAVWDADLAYQLRGCGLWVRRGHRPAKRLASGSLGDLRDGYVAWIADWPAGKGEQVQIARLGRRTRTIARSSIDAHGQWTAPTITHGSLVYGWDNDGEEPGGVDLYRLPLDERRACATRFTDSPRMAVPYYFTVAGFSVDDTAIFYVDTSSSILSPSRGIFQVAATRGRWVRTADCRSMRW